MGLDREREDVRAIKATYAKYDDAHRSRLWDRRNRGFHRLKSQAEASVLALVRSSLSAAGERVLDVGCGSGDYAVLARSAGIVAPWTGIDLLPDRIEAARAAAPDGTFLVGSADAMPFPDRSFDVAVALTLFSSLPSGALEAAVATEIERVLRPGGWLVWYDLRYSNPTNPAVHGVSAARLGELFGGWRMELRTTTLLPPIARRLGPLTPVVYPLLHAVPLFRSHLVGRLRSPS